MIELRSVTKTYPDGTTAVDDLDLVIRAGEITALVGSSGSGKTTVLRMINRMVERTAGVIEIDGSDVSTMDPVKLRRSIGYVMQSSGLLPHRSTLENIATVPRLNGQHKSLARTRALELMDTVGLDRNLANRYPRQLSGGQQQRAGVARALASDPNILLMDEPFGAVDPIVRTELQRELARLQQELGKTIVFVTHDVDEAFLLADQVVILEERGRVAQSGSPTDILTNPASDFVANFIGADRGRRQLHIENVDGTRVLVDVTGRPAGVLSK